MVKIVNTTLLIASIALFIYSLDSISKSLLTLSIPKIKSKIKEATMSTKASFITGFLSTLLIQSSSAIIALTISMVNANILTFNQSIGIVLGSNIATTFSSLLIGINLEKISPFFLIISFLFSKSKNKKTSSIFKIIFFISLLFFSIYLMSYSLSDLKDTSALMPYIKKATHSPILGLLIGTLLTAALQSSSLFIVILQILASTNIITINDALPLILGANIGTSFDAILTLFSSNKESKKLSHFSIFFNVITSIVFFVSLPIFSKSITFITNIFSLSVQTSIAISNIIFNILGVILTIPFIKQIKRYYSKW